MTTVIFLGASTRAAATSALRAGWTPWCADLFADADLERIATVRKISASTYPGSLIDALKDAPQAPVMYVGALENRPDLIARIDRPLWGNPAKVLRVVRDPQQWTQFVRAFRIASPSVARTPQADGAWLVKPLRSAGGVGIRAYERRLFNARTHFLQERIDGVSSSAIFLGSESLSALLYGVTVQLIGVPWLNASGYRYCGNIGPVPLDETMRSKWQYLGAVLQHIPLRGLFGVDAIVRNGEVWPIEINPRYTASMELLERSYGQSLLLPHRAVFDGSTQPWVRKPDSVRIWGKAILYARRTLAFPESGPWLDSLADGVDLDETEYADVPHAGEVIEQGRPVLTIFASAATTQECRVKLQEKAQALDRRLWG